MNVIFDNKFNYLNADMRSMSIKYQKNWSFSANGRDEHSLKPVKVNVRVHPPIFRCAVP